MSRMHYGRWEAVEDQADELIRASLEGVTRYSEKSDVLTAWKLDMRVRREVLTSSGFPEKHIRQGMYHRVANMAQPHLNSMDGISRAYHGSQGVAKSYVSYQGALPHDEDLGD